MRYRFIAALGALILTACSATEPHGETIPASRQALVRGRLSSPRSWAAMSLLSDGRVLLTGGLINGALWASDSADLYDPETGQITAAGPMLEKRSQHTSTTLRNGKVLIAGGSVDNVRLSSAELFDPVGGTFTSLPKMKLGHEGHTANLLPDGTVAIVGGDPTVPTCERFDPATNQWVSCRAPSVARSGHNGVLTSSDPVRLVISGGEISPNLGTSTDFSITEVYDPKTDEWTSIQRLPSDAGKGGSESAAVGLLDGGLLMAGLATGTMYSTEGLDQRGWVLGPTSWAVTGSCGADLLGVGTLMLPDGLPYAFGSFSASSGCPGGAPPVTEQTLVLQLGTAAGAPACTARSVSTELARREATSAVLPNGSVLSAGGAVFNPTATPCRWDPLDTLSVLHLAPPVATGVSALLGVRLDAAASTLASGAVLISGGTDGTGSLRSAELFSPSSGRSSGPIALGVARAGHTSTLLDDGRVLLAGGLGSSDQPLDTAELVDADGGVSPLIHLQQARAFHSATLLGDGRVLLAGGLTDGGTTATAELFDPLLLQTSPTTPMQKPRAHHAAAALRDGTVLVAGGQIDSSVLGSSERYLLDAGWEQRALGTARTGHTLTPIAAGALAIGGTGATGAVLASSEWFDADAGFSAGPSLGTARHGHTAALLSDGQLVVAGGSGDEGDGGALASCELLDVPTNTFLAGPPLAHARGRHVSAAGADTVFLFGGGPLAVDQVASGLVVLPQLVPTLPAELAGVHGAPLVVSGTGFLSYGENGGGNSRSVATNQPVFFLARPSGEGRRFLFAHDWTATSAVLELPADLPAGSYWLRVSVGGATSAPSRLRVLTINPPVLDAGTDGGLPQPIGNDGGVDGGLAGGADLYGCGCSGTGGTSTLALWLLGALAVLGRRATRGLAVLGLLVGSSAALAGTTRVAVSQLARGAGVSKALPNVVTDQLIAELQQRGYGVTSSKDMEAQLGHERQKQLLGCSGASSCMAEIAAALDVDVLVNGTISKVGSSLVLNVNALDLRQPSQNQHFTQRLKQATEEAVLDLVPAMVAQLFPGSKRAELRPPEPLPVIAPPIAPPPVERPAEPVVRAPLEAPAPRVHHLTVWASGAIAPQITATEGLHGAVKGYLGYRFDERWTLAAGFIGARPLGASLRASAVPAFVDAVVHPVVALEVPVLFSGPLSVGLGASLGVEWVPSPWFFVGLEVPVQYFFTAPAGVTRFWWFGALNAGVRI